MSGEKFFTTGLIVQFKDCGDSETARKRLNHLRLAINNLYAGAIQITANPDGDFGDDDISFPMGLGVRLDRYNPSNHSKTGSSRGRGDPEPVQLALDLVDGVNTWVDGVRIASRSGHLDMSSMSGIDVTDEEKFDPNTVNEHVTILGKTLASQYEEEPDWVNGRAGVSYHIGSVTYDATDFGGTDPEISVEEVASNLVEQAVLDLLPGDVLNRVSDDQLLVQLDIPDSLTRAMNNPLEWQNDIEKASLSSAGPPGVRMSVGWSNGLGFAPIEDIGYSYAQLED